MPISIGESTKDLDFARSIDPWTNESKYFPLQK